MRTAWVAGGLDVHVVASNNVKLGPSRRSVCVPRARKVGVRLRVKFLGLRYVRANSLKCLLWTLKCWRFKTRFFASFIFVFEKK
jgi:hypothetical protein